MRQNGFGLVGSEGGYWKCIELRSLINALFQEEVHKLQYCCFLVDLCLYEIFENITLFKEHEVLQRYLKDSAGLREEHQDLIGQDRPQILQKQGYLDMYLHYRLLL